jgi:hypothetical protein
MIQRNDQRDYGIRLGTVITLPLASPSQRQAEFNALAAGGNPQAGPAVTAVSTRPGSLFRTE